MLKAALVNLPFIVTKKEWITLSETNLSDVYFVMWWSVMDCEQEVERYNYCLWNEYKYIVEKIRGRERFESHGQLNW